MFFKMAIAYLSGRVITVLLERGVPIKWIDLKIYWLLSYKVLENQ